MISNTSFLFTPHIKFLQKGFIFHPQENKILTLRRSLDDVSRPGLWDLAGGNVQYPELHLESFKREVQEETGLAIVDIQPIQITTHYDKDEDLYRLFIGYKAKAVGTNVLLSHEHIKYRWVTIQEFLELESANYLKELGKLVLSNRD